MEERKDSVLDVNPKGHNNIYLVLQNLVIRSRSEWNGFTGKVAFIYWDDHLTIENIPISEQGSIQYDLVIPYTSKGDHVIYIEDDSNWSGSTGEVSFKVLPSIRIFPEIGTELSQVTIQGSGFDSKENGIGLIWDGKTQVAVNLTADNNGTWNTLFTVPNVTKGEHYFSATGSTTKADEIEDITFIVTPWSRIEPTSGPIDTKIQIMLWGFKTGESGIKLIWDGETIKYDLTADTKGDMLVTINPPECAAGNHLIQIQRRVTTKKGIFPDLYFKVTPKITLKSSTDITGTTILLSGTGYAKKAPLTISLDNKVINDDISTDNKGSFSAVLQMPETEKTEHTIIVKDESGNSSQYNFTMEKMAQLTTPQPMAPAQGYKTILIESIPDAFLKGPKYILEKDISMPSITFVWSKLDIEDGINLIQCGKNGRRQTRALQYWAGRCSLRL